jgi:hypothetical protein
VGYAPLRPPAHFGVHGPVLPALTCRQGIHPGGRRGAKTLPLLILNQTYERCSGVSVETFNQRRAAGLTPSFGERPSNSSYPPFSVNSGSDAGAGATQNNPNLHRGQPRHVLHAARRATQDWISRRPFSTPSKKRLIHLQSRGVFQILRSWTVTCKGTRDIYGPNHPLALFAGAWASLELWGSPVERPQPEFNSDVNISPTPVFPPRSLLSQERSDATPWAR